MDPLKEYWRSHPGAILEGVRLGFFWAPSPLGAIRDGSLRPRLPPLLWRYNPDAPRWTLLTWGAGLWADLALTRA